MKTMIPKNIYVRLLASGKFSFGEYIRAKWNNICEPFSLDNEQAIKILLESIETYKKQMKRDIKFCSYGSIPETELNKIKSLFNETNH